MGPHLLAPEGRRRVFDVVALRIRLENLVVRVLLRDGKLPGSSAGRRGGSGSKKHAPGVRRGIVPTSRRVFVFSKCVARVFAAVEVEPRGRFRRRRVRVERTAYVVFERFFVDESLVQPDRLGTRRCLAPAAVRVRVARSPPSSRALLERARSRVRGRGPARRGGPPRRGGRVFLLPRAGAGGPTRRRRGGVLSPDAPERCLAGAVPRVVRPGARAPSAPCVVCRRDGAERLGHDFERLLRGARPGLVGMERPGELAVARLERVAAGVRAEREHGVRPERSGREDLARQGLDGRGGHGGHRRARGWTTRQTRGDACRDDGRTPDPVGLLR